MPPLTPNEITYLLWLISQDTTSDMAEDETKRRLFQWLEALRDDTRESTRLLTKLDRIEREHRDILEIIEKQRRLILAR